MFGHICQVRDGSLDRQTGKPVWGRLNQNDGSSGNRNCRNWNTLRQVIKQPLNTNESCILQGHLAHYQIMYTSSDCTVHRWAMMG